MVALCNAREQLSTYSLFWQPACSIVYLTGTINNKQHKKKIKGHRKFVKRLHDNLISKTAENISRLGCTVEFEKHR